LGLKIAVDVAKIAVDVAKIAVDVAKVTLKLLYSKGFNSLKIL
jgi:hypothetical protein